MFDWWVLNTDLQWVRLNYATTHHYPPSPTTSQNISTTTHYHTPQAKIYPLACPTTRQQPKCIHHHHQQSKIYPSKKLFYKKNIKIFYSKLNDEKHFG